MRFREGLELSAKFLDLSAAAIGIQMKHPPAIRGIGKLFANAFGDCLGVFAVRNCETGRPRALSLIHISFTLRFPCNLQLVFFAGCTQTIGICWDRQHDDCERRKENSIFHFSSSFVIILKYISTLFYILLPILSTKDWQFPTISIGGRI